MGDVAHQSRALAVDLGGRRRLDRSAARRGGPAEVDPSDPTSLDRAAAAVWHDEGGEVDTFLLQSGIRHVLLRQVPRAVRVAWWKELRGLPLPEGTRVCWDGAEVWYDEAERRIVAQGWQHRRMLKWLRFAALVAKSARRSARPITGPGLTLTELQVALGDPGKPITKRWVTEIIAWYRAEKLLRVVMPGTRVARLDVPEDELKFGEPQRTAFEVAVEAAHDARHRTLKRWHEDELDARRAGVAPPPHPDELGAFREHLGAMPERDDDVFLLRVAQVYELLVPEAPDVRDAPPQRSRPRNVVNLADVREKRAQARNRALRADDAKPGAKAALSGLKTRRHRGGGPARPLADLSVSTEASESSTPSFFTTEGGSVSTPSGVVDEGAASPRSQGEVLALPEGPNHPSRVGSDPVRAAWRLLRGILTTPLSPSEAVLPRQLCIGVSPNWLARRIAPYVRAGFTDAQLVAVIAHRGGTWSYVPPVVKNPCGWIRAALKRWSPTAPPLPDEIREAAAEVEAESEHEHEKRRRRAAGIHKAGHWAAIAGCELCDDNGFRQLDGAGPLVRCYHSPADDDEVAAADVDEGQDQDDEPGPATVDEARALIDRVARGLDDPVKAEMLAEAHRRLAARRQAEDKHTPRALRRRGTWRRP